MTEDEVKLKVKFEDKISGIKFDQDISLKLVPEATKKELQHEFEKLMATVAKLKVKYGSDDD